METVDTITIGVEADIAPFRQAMAEVEKSSRSFGATFASAIKSAIVNGKSFEETLKSIALRLSGSALSAGLKPLEGLANSFLGSLVSSFAAPNSGFSAGFSAPQSIFPFAQGGVVAQPTFFSAGQQLGVMGEAGAEAILPLARGSDGRLGVRAQSGGVQTHVVFNVTTGDALSFARSESQISAMLARAVARGSRHI